MSPPLGEPSLDQHYSATPPDGHDQYYDTYPALVPTAVGPVSDFYTSENWYLCQDVDGTYHWADASAARSDSCMGYSFPFYHASPLASEAFPTTLYGTYPHGDFDEPSQPTAAHDTSYIFHLAQQFSYPSGRPQVQDHRSSIARASDNFLAQGSSIFSDGHSTSRRASALDYRSSIPRRSSPQRDPHPPSRKRSRESLDEGNYHVKEKDDNVRPALPTANDTCRLSQSHMIVPSQAVPSSSVRIPHPGDAPTSLNAESHARKREPRLRSEDTSNKRVHRASEELVRQENTIMSIPTTWPIPDDPVMKGTKKPGEQKKQALACLFCRERKIACGRPPAHHPDQTCNQCSRRRMKCEYPTESRRGQHKRRRKPVEGEPASQSVARTSTSSSCAGSLATATSSTTLMTAPPSA